jgi:sodium-independent sulfate anion transporter 11
MKVPTGALSLSGGSPFLKEEGLVHLTVRDAIDAVLIRAENWSGVAPSNAEGNNSGSDSDSNSGLKDKTEIHYV